MSSECMSICDSNHITHRGWHISQETQLSQGQGLVSTNFIMGKSTQGAKDRPEDICSQDVLFHP